LLLASALRPCGVRVCFTRTDLSRSDIVLAAHQPRVQFYFRMLTNSLGGRARNTNSRAIDTTSRIPPLRPQSRPFPGGIFYLLHVGYSLLFAAVSIGNQFCRGNARCFSHVPLPETGVAWNRSNANIESPFLTPCIVSACPELSPECSVAQSRPSVHEKLVAADTMAAPAQPDSAAVDGSTGSAVKALLSRIVESPGLIAACTGYQDGTEMALYEDGDVAASEGHLSLLVLRRALCTSSIIRKGSRRTGGVGTKDDYEERNQLEDLKFSHRAADWAAAQGHLEVVRSAVLLLLR